MPEPLAQSAPKLARADREYHIAAAFFYGGHFDRAAELFDASRATASRRGGRSRRIWPRAHTRGRER
jgi:hypothetical protein